MIVIILTSDALPNATAFFQAWDHHRVEVNGRQLWLNCYYSIVVTKEAKKKIQIEHLLIFSNIAMHGFDNNNMVFSTEYYRDYGKTWICVKAGDTHGQFTCTFCRQTHLKRSIYCHFLYFGKMTALLPSSAVNWLNNHGIKCCFLCVFVTS